MSDLKFADTHNLVAFLEKPTKSEGFEEIVDFLNANPIKYALTVNPTIYCSCVKQFWDTVKAKTVNGEVQLQALVDKKKVIITESTIRRDLQLEDANGVDCLPNAAIFEQLTLMGYEKLSQKLTFYKAFFSPQWKFLIHTILQCLSAKTTAWNEFSSTMASAIICLATNQKFNFSKYIFDNMVKNVDSMVQFWMYPRFVQVFVNKQVGDMSHHKRIYVTPSHTKKIFWNMKREGKGFPGRRKQKSRKQPQRKKKNTEDPQPSGSTDNVPDENVPTTSNDPLLSGEDRLKLTELIDLCTNLQKKVLDLEKAKTAQDSEIATRRVESSDEASLGDQEDASKQGRKITNIDADAEVTLIDETQGRDDDNLMFDTGVLDEQEVEVEKTLIEIKAAKPKVRGVMIQEPSEFTTTTTTPTASKPSQDKGKAKMIESEEPLNMKPKDQAQRLQVEEQEELTIEEKSKLFQQLLEKRRKHFAAKRAEERRSKPPTKAQQRSSEIREEESNFKRVGDELEQEPTKKQKVDDDKEREDLQQCFELVTEEDVAIDAIPLATKPVPIVNFQIHRKGRNGYYEIIRADGSAKTYLLFSQMLKEFDRQDLENLCLKICIFYMLESEKRYPLTPTTITDMLNKKLKSDYWNEMCYQLLKLMTKQLKNPGSGRIVGIKSFIRLFGITAALIKVSAAQEERVNAAGTKLQLLTELQLLMDKD
ncbi:hypothetical protein Tco_1406711 [Tanacetum coccineum]